MRVFWWFLGEYFTSLLIFGLFYSKSSTTNQPLTANALVSGIRIQGERRQKWQIGLNFHFGSAGSSVCDGPDEDQTCMKHQILGNGSFQAVSSLNWLNLRLLCAPTGLWRYLIQTVSHWCGLIYGSLMWRSKDQAINRKLSDVNSGVALKESKGKHR